MLNFRTSVDSILSIELNMQVPVVGIWPRVTG